MGQQIPLTEIAMTKGSPGWMKNVITTKNFEDTSNDRHGNRRQDYSLNAPGPDPVGRGRKRQFIQGEMQCHQERRAAFRWPAADHATLERMQLSSTGGRETDAENKERAETLFRH